MFESSRKRMFPNVHDSVSRLPFTGLGLDINMDNQKYKMRIDIRYVW